jgi:hypothetical protein
MSEPRDPWGPPPYGAQPQYGAQPSAYPVPYPHPAQYGGPAPIGQVRSTGITMLLFFVTFGIYGYVWWYQVHDEMKRHNDQGLGGGLALVISLFAGVVMPFITSNEVGDLYARRGQRPPVTALTGLWYFPGIFILAGPFIWFVQTNEALNDYWRSLGAV